ncbi:Bicupin, oxalate decarboxylase/oxidase [Schizophyllum commune Tattone D]|nr:Bicupin, oxalate decarboxylase/oxidase [Schizophyllum commune Tattone D]
MFVPFGLSLLLASSVIAAPAATSDSAAASSSVASSVDSAAPSSSLASASDSASAASASPSVTLSAAVSSSASPSASAVEEEGSITPVSVTVDPVPTAANDVEWDPYGPETTVEPVRGALGAPFSGPTNPEIDFQNPDLLAPPNTDFGSVGSGKWSLSLSPTRLLTGGWVRYEDELVMPLGDEMAGANIHLEPGAIRELHWHSIAEWVYVLAGETQISAVDQKGRNYFATAKTGDLWFFPSGVGHHLQATGDGPSEFVLIFKTGLFDAAKTFHITDWVSHIPFSVLQKNFGVQGTDAFSKAPSKQLYIFPHEAPSDETIAPESPQGEIPDPYVFNWSEQPYQEFAGGKVKTVDASTFKASKDFSAAEVVLEPGAMRELHWHTSADEWSFFIEGNLRYSVFTEVAARTYDMSPGDVGYAPISSGHYIENIGNTTARFLEVIDAPEFEDISLTQWLALTPPEIVKAHFGVDDATVAGLSKTKNRVVQG